MAHGTALVWSAHLSRPHVRRDLLGPARDGRANLGFCRRHCSNNPIHVALGLGWSHFLLDQHLLGWGCCSLWGRNSFWCADSVVSQGTRALLGADLRRLVDHLFYTALRSYGSRTAACLRTECLAVA